MLSLLLLVSVVTAQGHDNSTAQVQNVDTAQGSSPDCSDLLSDVLHELSNTHPETDQYLKGLMNATLVIPLDESPCTWELQLQFSRSVDQLTSEASPTSADQTTFSFTGTSDNSSSLSLPFSVTYTGGPAPIELHAVVLNGHTLCDNKTN